MVDAVPLGPSPVEAIARLHHAGVPVNWAGVWPQARTVPLPFYAFQRRRYWLLPETSAAPRPRPAPDRASGGGKALLDLVLAAVGVATGTTPDRTDARRPFTELGVNSVRAVELRNHLDVTAGVQLPVSLVFDHPTPAAVVDLLTSLRDGGTAPRAAAAVVDELEALVTTAPFGPDPALAARLRAVAARLAGTSSTAPGDLATATDEELFHLLDN
jgi:pimaricinolide synthase loading module/candicidin polyketide synthase FscA